MECRKPQKRKNLRLLILTTNLSKPGHDVAGLFFCLASAEGAGLFLSSCNTATYKRLQRPYSVYANYTAHAAKQHTGLCRRFPSYLPCFAAAVWRVHPAIPHRLRHAGRCTAQRNRPIIYKVYKSAPPVMDPLDGAAYHRPCQPGGVSSYRVRIAGKCRTRRTC